MAARATWKGYLKISLVNIPIKVFPATESSGSISFEQPLNLADYKDQYRAGLQAIIDAKIAGEEVVATTSEAPPKVVNLMDALRKSLDSVSANRKKPAKAVSSKPAAAKRKRA